jgi:hypothetical protein
LLARFFDLECLPIGALRTDLVLAEMALARSSLQFGGRLENLSQ